VGFALSAGMRARLQLARALLHRPRILVLDEPTGSVDPVGAFQLLQLIAQIAQDDATAVFVSSHRLEEIEALRDRIILLDRGQILHAGPLDALRAAWGTSRLRLEFHSVEAAHAAERTLISQLGLDSSSVDDRTLEVRESLPMGQILHALDGSLEHVDSVSETRLSLREVLTLAANGNEAIVGTAHGTR
jgi:ABC-2 type transport system ATP-binding protein